MRITCPECATVLKPANPIAAGKKVKCPRCGTVFPVTDEEAEATPARAGAVKKKPGDAPRPATKSDKQPAATSGDDDDEGGIYALADAPDATTTTDEDEERPEIDYAPDTSIKDLRGPAQAAVIQPTNMMIGAGVAGFIGWLALLVVFTIPVLFPIESDEGTKDAPKNILKIQKGIGMMGDEAFVPEQQKPAGSTDKANVSFYQFMGNDLSNVALYAWYMFLLMMFPIFLCMVYTSLQTYGAVRAQNLESRGWGIASSIMGMIPLSIAGLACFVTMIFSFVLNMLLDDEDTIQWTIYGIWVIFGLLQIAAAVYTLITLVRPEVIDGFEYVPDMEKEEEEKEEKRERPRRKKRR
jgi:predicted Zn finger-like uncharacterized protein